MSKTAACILTKSCHCPGGGQVGLASIGYTVLLIVVIALIAVLVPSVQIVFSLVRPAEWMHYLVAPVVCFAMAR